MCCPRCPCCNPVSRLLVQGRGCAGVGWAPCWPHHFAPLIIRYYSGRRTSVVRTKRPNLVASTLLIPNFSFADQVIHQCLHQRLQQCLHRCLHQCSYQCNNVDTNVHNNVHTNFYTNVYNNVDTNVFAGHLCLPTRTHNCQVCSCSSHSQEIW